MIWTREDDLTQGPFRPGSLNLLEAYFDNSRQLKGLYHKVIAPVLSAEKEPLSPEIITDGINKKYQIRDYRIECVIAPTTIPIGAFRSVYASTNTFAHECFIDELAFHANKDAIEFRKELLSDDPRYLRLLSALEEKSGWQKNPPAGTGMGVALIGIFGSYCGHVFKLAKHNDIINIEKVTAVIDCGININPSNIKAQIEGSIIMGLTAALKDQITFEKGRVQQKNFNTYRMFRINETPDIEVHIIQNEEKPGGVGEVGFPSVAPAFANALFSLTKKRIRNLPIDVKSL